MSYTDFVIESGESRPPKLGRYELITRIGQGGMAEVQLAIQRGPAGFEKLVVVKLVHENLASQKAFVDMLLDEARVAALVKHPNVVDIYDLGEAEGRYFIAMEYLEGEPLLAVLRAGREGQRLDVLSTARLIADTAEGLDAAHELRSLAGDPIELVHHDVSLGNIVVLYNGQVKLVDFGVAKATQSATVHTKVQGKFSYMAPEKLRGDPGDRRSDIWSLGCVLWEALTLRRLFRGANENDTVQQVLENVIVAPSKVNGDVTADFDAIVLRSLQRDPSKRYPTAKAMAAEIEEVLRKHGYAAKNDVIAKYMQSTFRSRIAARKKLLQEVSSKGRASPDVLAAAFNTGAIASGSPILSTGELASTRKPSGELPPVGKPAARRLPPPPRTARAADERAASVPLPRIEVFDPSDDAAFDPPSITVEPLDVLAPRTGVARGSAGDERTVVDQPQIVRGGVGDECTVVEQPQIARGKRWILPVAGAVVVVVVVAIAVLAARGGSPGDLTAAVASGTLGSSAPASAEPAPPPVEPSTPQPPAATQLPAPPAATAQPASPAPAATVQPASRIEAATAGAPAEPNAKPARSRRTQTSRSAQPAKPPSDKTSATSAEDLVKAGLQAWVIGDARTALALYRRALQANAAYAPAWRCIGAYYERQGNKTTARNAFQRYLEIAPDASDAAGIRARLESL